MTSRTYHFPKMNLKSSLFQVLVIRYYQCPKSCNNRNQVLMMVTRIILIIVMRILKIIIMTIIFWQYGCFEFRAQKCFKKFHLKYRSRIYVLKKGTYKPHSQISGVYICKCQSCTKCGNKFKFSVVIVFNRLHTFLPIYQSLRKFGNIKSIYLQLITKNSVVGLCNHGNQKGV